MTIRSAASTREPGNTRLDAVAQRLRARREFEQRARAHGHQRASDARGPATPASTGSSTAHAYPRGVLPIGVLAIGFASILGISRVRASNEVLQLGQDIASLTSEHQRLQGVRRSLEAERAWLRNPTRVQRLSSSEEALAPVTAERTIRLTKASPASVTAATHAPRARATSGVSAPGASRTSNHEAAR